VLDITKGLTSEVDFENHLQSLEYYSRKARLLHKISQCNQLIDADSGENRAQLELELETLWAELDAMAPPSPKP
jgi:hypothetical protein